MAKFGPCSEPLCTETSIRLFDCAHHCMKLVCLQHLIEHDQLINSNSQCLNNLRSELEQLWTVYSTSIDETKLYSEFEQQLTKHQQLIQEVTNLIENDSLNIEEYQITLEKLKTSIEQEKQCIQSSSRSVLGELVKMECFDEPSSNDKPSMKNRNFYLITVHIYMFLFIHRSVKYCFVNLCQKVNQSVFFYLIIVTYIRLLRFECVPYE